MEPMNPVYVLARLLGPAIERQIEKAREETDRRIEEMAVVK